MNNLRMIKTDKFKDVMISLRFASETQMNKTERSLLAIMLTDRSSLYNTKVLMSKQLDNMFGAGLASAVFNYGQAHVIEIAISALSAKFVDEDLLEKQVKFLSEIVYNPLLNQEVFDEAKAMLGDMISRESDNLGSYAITEAIKIAGENYPLSYSRHGDLETLEKLELSDIIKTYESFIENDTLNIIGVGDVEDDVINKLFEENFKNHHSSKRIKNNYLVKTDEVKDVVVHKDIQQAYFTIVYNTHTLNAKKEYWTLQLMTMILGQLPNSYLFQEIREKRSLCYTIRSSVVGYDGVMYITSGVRVGSEDEAIKVSMEQVDRIQAGDVELELFNSAKSMLKNSVYQTNDSSSRIIDSEYRKIILDEPQTTDDLISIIDSVQLSEVVEISQRLQLNTIYRLIKQDVEDGE